MPRQPASQPPIQPASIQSSHDNPLMYYSIESLHCCCFQPPPIMAHHHMMINAAFSLFTSAHYSFHSSLAVRHNTHICWMLTVQEWSASHWYFLKPGRQHSPPTPHNHGFLLFYMPKIFKFTDHRRLWNDFCFLSSTPRLSPHIMDDEEFPQQQFFVSVSSLYLIKTIASHTILPQMTIKNVCRAWTTPGLCNLLPASAPHCPGNPIQLFGNDDVLLGCAPPAISTNYPSPSTISLPSSSCCPFIVQCTQLSLNSAFVCRNLSPRNG